MGGRSFSYYFRGPHVLISQTHFSLFSPVDEKALRRKEMQVRILNELELIMFGIHPRELSGKIESNLIKSCIGVILIFCCEKEFGMLKNIPKCFLSWENLTELLMRYLAD